MAGGGRAKVTANKDVIEKVVLHFLWFSVCFYFAAAKRGWSGKCNCKHKFDVTGKTLMLQCVFLQSRPLLLQLHPKLVLAPVVVLEKQTVVFKTAVVVQVMPISRFECVA